MSDQSRLPPLPSQGIYATDYTRKALPDGRVEVTRVSHGLTRSGDKDTWVDTWIEGGDE